MSGVGSVWLDSKGVALVEHLGGRFYRLLDLVDVAHKGVTEVEFVGTWKHEKSGTLYTVSKVCNLHSTKLNFPLIAEYSCPKGIVYACSASSFYRRMEKVDD